MTYLYRRKYKEHLIIHADIKRFLNYRPHWYLGYDTRMYHSCQCSCIAV